MDLRSQNSHLDLSLEETAVIEVEILDNYEDTVVVASPVRDWVPMMGKESGEDPAHSP